MPSIGKPRKRAGFVTRQNVAKFIHLDLRSLPFCYDGCWDSIPEVDIQRDRNMIKLEVLTALLCVSQ